MLTLLAMPTSRPAPTVQPALVALPPGNPGLVALMSPAARPAGDVGQEPVEGVAETAAHGGEPLVAGLATGRAQHVRGAFDARPVDVAFGADHDLANLPVVTDGAADQAAGDIELGDPIPLGMTPAAAAIDADIEAGPVVDRIVSRPDRLVARQIGSAG